jgi:DNA-binding PadR family transcriptional regulator
LFYRHCHSHERSHPHERSAFREGIFEHLRQAAENHRHGGGHRRRESRVFDHGDLRLVITALIAEKPRYGYEIIKELEERVGGGYSPSPGVVYPTLTLIEEVGHATVANEQGGRRLYTLSSEGAAYLAANRTQVDAIFARLDRSSARRGPPNSVQRAFENLGVAVRLRLKGHNATEEQIRAIADAIDAAAKAIETI